MSRKTVATAFALVVVAAWWLGRVPAFVPGVYAFASVVAYAIYAHDKSAARGNKWRTPEARLHMIALAGGWPGALLAQDVLRHKSSKRSFQWMFWLTVIVNCGAMLWLSSRR